MSKTTNTNQNGISPELKEKLSNADPDIQKFFDALRAELSKLHKRTLRLEAENVSLHSKISVLELELKKRRPLSELSDEELESLVHEIEVFKKKTMGAP